MARTPLASAVEDAVARIADDELRVTRRGLIKGAGAAVVGATMVGRLAGSARAANRDIRIAVVGAGLAGLTCAYRLERAGLIADVYEASSRVGGRCYTGRGDFADGQIYEHGGELIDTGHHAIRNLAAELGLKLDNLLNAERRAPSSSATSSAGRTRSSEMVSDFQAVLRADDRRRQGGGIPDAQYNSYTQRGYELDHLSVYDYIEQYVPGGHRSPLGALLDVAYNIEYGAETKEQSSLNLLYLIGYSRPNTFETFGESDEKFRIHGGNDQVPTALAAKLAAQIVANTALDRDQAEFRQRRPG